MIGKRSVVQGYLYDGVSDEYAERNNTVCRIVARVEGDDIAQDLMDNGPAFLVEFGDQFQMVAYSSELHPWYQTG